MPSRYHTHCMHFTLKPGGRLRVGDQFKPLPLLVTTPLLGKHLQVKLHKTWLLGWLQNCSSCFYAKRPYNATQYQHSTQSRERKKQLMAVHYAWHHSFVTTCNKNYSKTFEGQLTRQTKKVLLRTVLHNTHTSYREGYYHKRSIILPAGRRLF